MALRHGVERRHADARRQVGAALLAQLKGYAVDNAVHRVLDVDDEVADAEGIDQQLCHVDIRLLAVGHQHADDPVLSQRFHAEGGDNGAVLAARNTDNGVAALSVLFKKIAYPLYAFAFDLFSIKHTIFPRLFFSFTMF